MVRIFNFAIMTYLKKLIGIKSFNTKQCTAVFSPRIILCSPVSPILPKDSTIKWFWLRGWELGFYFSKEQRSKLFPQKERGYYYERVIYDCCLLLCLYVQETLQSKISFWEWVLAWTTIFIYVNIVGHGFNYIKLKFQKYSMCVALRALLVCFRNRHH